nr:hypothetical protein [Halomicronema hongdechloris]
MRRPRDRGGGVGWYWTALLATVQQLLHHGRIIHRWLGGRQQA